MIMLLRHQFRRRLLYKFVLINESTPGKMTSYELVCVVAMAQNRVIGDGSGLVWHLPDDLKRVKALTMGCPLIMGRKTWESIGRPLPGRASIVMTRDKAWQADGAITVTSLDRAIKAGKAWLDEQDGNENRLILFGGGQIYAEGLSRCNRIEMTLIETTPDQGVVFPETSSQDWDERCLKPHPKDGDVPSFRYQRMTRKVPIFV